VAKFSTNQKPRNAFKGFVSALTKTRGRFTTGIKHLFTRGDKLNEAVIEELETNLLQADVGLATSKSIINKLRTTLRKSPTSDSNSVYEQFRQDLLHQATSLFRPFTVSDARPFVVLVVGVNGVGKTTTIGKLAHIFRTQDYSVLLAAADTYRAAAIEQLQNWGIKCNVPVVAQRQGADSASVVHDAVQSAQAKSIDVVIADTAGRLQTKSGLMAELSKVQRVLKRLDTHAPHECLLVLDATIGQNALSQLKTFEQTVDVTGLVLTKLDGTAKGGIVLALSSETTIPLYFVGLGEKLNDLHPYDPEAYVAGLVTP